MRAMAYTGGHATRVNVTPRSVALAPSESILLHC